MIRQAMRILGHASLVIIAALQAGCGGGDAGAFVQACMNESGSPAGAMFEQNMGVSKDAFCKCGAKTAKASLSGKAFHAMVLDMQGKKQEAYEITSKMDPAEQQQVIMGMMTVFQNCAKPDH